MFQKKFSKFLKKLTVNTLCLIKFSKEIAPGRAPIRISWSEGQGMKDECRLFEFEYQRNVYVLKQERILANFYQSYIRKESIPKEDTTNKRQTLKIADSASTAPNNWK